MLGGVRCPGAPRAPPLGQHPAARQLPGVGRGGPTQHARPAGCWPPRGGPTTQRPRRLEWSTLKTSMTFVKSTQARRAMAGSRAVASAACAAVNTQHTSVSQPIYSYRTYCPGVPRGLRPQQPPAPGPGVLRTAVMPASQLPTCAITPATRPALHPPPPSRPPGDVPPLPPFRCGHPSQLHPEH
jgi:hypothetical protein